MLLVLGVAGFRSIVCAKRREEVSQIKTKGLAKSQAKRNKAKQRRVVEPQAAMMPVLGRLELELATQSLNSSLPTDEDAVATLPNDCFGCVCR